MLMDSRCGVGLAKIQPFPPVPSTGVFARIAGYAQTDMHAAPSACARFRRAAVAAHAAVLFAVKTMPHSRTI